jgi:hypothetical protein
VLVNQSAYQIPSWAKTSRILWSDLILSDSLASKHPVPITRIAVGGLQDILKIFVMNTWEDVGGSDMWLTSALETNEMYYVFHCTHPKTKIWSREASWYYKGQYNWLTYGVPEVTATPTDDAPEGPKKRPATQSNDAPPKKKPAKATRKGKVTAIAQSNDALPKKKPARKTRK